MTVTRRMNDEMTMVVDDSQLIAKLRSAGLRATRPRLLVLSALAESPAHISTDELVAALVARGTPLPRGSVYNVVGALVSRGLMMVTDIGPGRAIYELAEQWHHHFVCRSCGQIQDVDCIVGEKPYLDQADVEGEVDEAQVIFRGLCAACKARSRSSA